MIDLRQKLKSTARHLEEFLSRSRDQGKNLGVLFYHTHPNFGQSHLYIGQVESVEPVEEILGKLIEDVIDYDGFLDSTTWWDGETLDGKLDMIRLCGDHIRIEDNEQFNVVWAQDVESIIREACLTIDSSLIPSRIVIYSQSGEYRADWHPNK